MAAPVVAGSAFAALIKEGGDLSEAAVREIASLLRTPIVIEFGGYGARLGGRWRRRNQSDAAYLRRVEIPLVVIAAGAYLIGVWRPTGMIGRFFAWLFGGAGPGLAEVVVKTAQNVQEPFTPEGAIGHANRSVIADLFNTFVAPALKGAGVDYRLAGGTTAQGSGAVQRLPPGS